MGDRPVDPEMVSTRVSMQRHVTDAKLVALKIMFNIPTSDLRVELRELEDYLESALAETRKLLQGA